MDLLGQENALRYLSEGLRQSRLSPSLLFVGPDGVGKRSAGLELAKCFVCEAPESIAPGLPRCGRCAACRRVDELNHPDLLYVDRAVQAILLREKPESQTAMKIETARQVDKFLHLRPSEGRRRVAIIDEAHRLTNEAANALLKLLEEPPNNAQIVLCAVDEHALPTTILSRCAVLRFRPVASGPIARWLQTVHGLDQNRAEDISDRSGGSFQRAIALKDEEPAALDLSEYAVDTFFEALNDINWRKEGRKQAERIVDHLIEAARKELDGNDPRRSDRLNVLLASRRRIDRNVPPKLVLENMFLELEAKGLKERKGE